MNYERAKELRTKYLDETKYLSAKDDAEKKLDFLAKLVSRAFYTNPLSSKNNPDKLPSFFTINSDVGFYNEYENALLESVLRDLGYENFSTELSFNADEIYIEFKS